MLNSTYCATRLLKSLHTTTARALRDGPGSCFSHAFCAHQTRSRLTVLGSGNVGLRNKGSDIPTIISIHIQSPRVALKVYRRFVSRRRCMCQEIYWLVGSSHSPCLPNRSVPSASCPICSSLACTDLSVSLPHFDCKCDSHVVTQRP